MKTIDRIEDIRINADVGLRMAGLLFEDFFGFPIRSDEPDTHRAVKRTREFDRYIERKKSAILISRRDGLEAHSYSIYKSRREQRYTTLNS